MKQTITARIIVDSESLDWTVNRLDCILGQENINLLDIHTGNITQDDLNLARELDIIQ